MYAHQVPDDPRREAALALVDRLNDRAEGAISIQILQELFVSLTRSGAKSLPMDEARIVIADLASGWRVYSPTAPDVMEAIDAAARWNIAFWDAMVVVAAQRSGSTVLWTEDLNHGQRFGDLEVRNPFR